MADPGSPSRTVGRPSPPDPSPLFRTSSFRNIVVYPTQAMLTPPLVLYRGGPDWPAFWLRHRARHCRYSPPIPLDLRPRRSGGAVAEEAAGIWCGPVTRHFGHAIASFGSRIPVAGRLPTDAPLVFSARPGEPPPSFFWEILAHFGVEAGRVRIVAAPTRFAELSVTAQPEPLGGDPPAAYLDLLDDLAGPQPRRDGSRLYVSRAGMWKGKVAGESYIEETLAQVGYATFRPETVGIAEQLAAYRRASHLVFAEGSALHGLQLLGRLPASVAVVARRNRNRLAQAALRPRVASLHYIDAVSGVLKGVGRHGWPQPSAGMTILDEEGFLAGLERLGVPIRSVWEGPSFRERQTADLVVWREARRRHPTHPRDEQAVGRSLRGLGIALDA